MADVALRMVTAISRIGIPVDGAVSGNLECRVTLLVQILAILGLDREWIAAAVGQSDPPGRNGDRNTHEKNAAQGLPSTFEA